MPTLTSGAHAMPHPKPGRRQRGLTLVEAATVTGIVAVLVGVSLPSWQELTQRRQLEGVAAQLETDLQLARSEAVARNESVRLSFDRGVAGSCYVVHTGPAGACGCDDDGAVACEAGAQAARSVHLGAGSPVQIRSNSASLLFDATKGTVTPTGTVRVQADIGSVHLVINVMGRVRACSPEARIPGQRPC